MDTVIINVIVVFILEAIATPLIVFVMQRATAKKLDAFDHKREVARLEQEQNIKRDQDWRSAMTGGMRSMLRSELLHEHRKWTNMGYCPLESKEYIQRTYDAYHALGGNGLGTAMCEEIMSLPMSERSME